MTVAVLAQIAAGGAIGAVLRHLSNQGIQRLAGSAFPFHTAFVNVTGSAMMGALMVLLAHKGGMRFAPFLMTGLLGGFTTFSAFSMDSILLWERGQVAAALLYIGGSVLLSLLAFAAGAAILRGIVS